LGGVTAIQAGRTALDNVGAGIQVDQFAKALEIAKAETVPSAS
jgi:hypothetical protein